MFRQSPFLLVVVVVLSPRLTHAEGVAGQVKKAVERCTLDQPGTAPFHLKATVMPTFDRDTGSGRTGQVEIWWASPTRWRREVQSAEFHQTEIVDSTHDWQKNDGDYLPEWLRQTEVELIKPVPPLSEVLQQVKSAEVHNFVNPANRSVSQVSISWVTNTGTTEDHNISRSSILLGSTGLLLYAGGLGWGGEFSDYAAFHGRMIARIVKVAEPQVTARVITLEDLAEVPADFFNAGAPDNDPHPIRTVLLDETSLRKNLLPAEPVAWPPLQDGPLEGNVTSEIVVDRQGKVREVGSIVCENMALKDAGRQWILAMQFSPFVQNGVPVQVLSQITIPFKTIRPAGVEIFESARAYFERGRLVGFPASAGKPYLLKAEFDAGNKSGAVAKGRYEDTWLSETQWRREGWFEDSHYVRSRNGDKLYQLAEGPEAAILQFVLKVLEPIPATDTMQEADWRIKRDTVNGLSAVRVLSGYESPEGKLDSEQARGFWFDDSGLLVKSFFNGLEGRRSDFQDFGGVRFPRRIDVLKDNSLAMRISVTGITAPGEIPTKNFEIKGHSWQRAFTSEVR